MRTPEPWSREAALVFCESVEPLAAQCGCHVAMTGGCLYGKGSRFRKDLDLVFYRHGGTSIIDMAKLFSSLALLDVHSITGSGWRYVAKYHGKTIDMLFPG